MTPEQVHLVAPPAWSSRFDDYFSTLKSWVLESAYPALVSGPLKTDPSVLSIPSEISQIAQDLKRSQPIPIALVGVTGVGKSTLLNALLEQEFLPVGVIGSQTAAFVSISYAPSWEVTCEYIDADELNAIFADSVSEVNEQNETGSPEARERAERKVRAILTLASDAKLPSREELHPPAEIIEAVTLRKRRFDADSAWKDALVLHAKGRLWPITKTIDVRGPFQMLKTGVVISDLPGTGDLNRARANQATAAIKDAGQIIIAADSKLLQTSLMDQLEVVARLPHRLFMPTENVQVVLVGTSLDKNVPDPAEEAQQVVDLGLDPVTATKQDVFAAICRDWQREVIALFKSWLSAKAAQFLPDSSSDERETRVREIMSRVVAIPTSAKDYARLKKKNPPQYCRSVTETGLPQVQEEINRLANDQIASTISAFSSRIETLRQSVLSSLERSEGLLGADIKGILDAVERSHAKMQEVQERQTQIVEDLRLNVLERFQQIRETLADKIANAVLKMRNVGRQQVDRHLAGLHWASLRATVNHQGLWLTSGNRQVNLRDAMGGEVTTLVPMVWSKIADERIRKEVDGSRLQVLAALKSFSTQIQAIVEAEVHDETSRKTVRRLFQASLKRAESIVGEKVQAVTSLLGGTSRDMQRRVDEAIDLSLAGVCRSCSEDRGNGWKLRSVARIIEGTAEVADQAEERCQKIAEDAFVELENAVQLFTSAAAEEMASIGSNIPDILRDAVATSQLTMPKTQLANLQSARAAAPAVFTIPPAA